MALDLGELSGELGLDISPLEMALRNADSLLDGFAASGEATAKSAGDQIGKGFGLGLDTIPVAAKAAADGVKVGLDQIPPAALAAANETARSFGIGLDEVSRLLDELPKNAKGTVSETSAEFRALPAEVKAVVLDAKAAMSTAFDTLPVAAGDAAARATDQLKAGLGTAEPAARAAGRTAGEGFSSEFASKAKDAGKVAGAAVGVALSAGVVDNLNLDLGQRKLAAQLGMTVEESKRLGGIAGTVYAQNFGGSLDEVRVAVGSVISSLRGMRRSSDAEIGAATATALTFADVFDIDIQRAVSVAGTVLRSGLAKDAETAFDLISAASSRVPAALREDVLDAAEEYSQFFDTLGYSGKQAFALLVEGSKKGMYGIDKMGDAVKEFTIRSTDMSTSSKAAYKMIGLDARDMANDILAGGDRAQRATRKIIDGLLSIKDPAKQGAAAIALFGTPLEDLNASDIPKFLTSLKGGSNAMDDFRGSAQDMADTVGGGTANSIETAKRGIQEWGRNAIESTGPTTVLAGALAAFGPAALSVIGPVASLVAARGVQAAAATTAATAETAAATATKAGWISSAATAMASAIRMAAAWVIAMGPIAIAIAAIALIAFLVYKYWDEIKAATMAVWDWVVAFIGDHLTLILTVVLGPLGLLIGLIISHWDQVKSATAAAWNWVVDKIKAVPGFLVAAFMNFTLPGLIMKHWDSIKSGTINAWDAVVGFVKSIPSKLLSFFLNWTLAGQIIKHWDEAKDGTIRVATGIVEWVGGLPGRIVAKLMSLGGQLFDTATSAFQRIRDAAENKVTSLITYVRGIPGRAKAAIGDLGGILLDAGRALIQGLINGITEKIGALTDKLHQITDLIPGHKGPIEKDLVLLRPAGRAIMQGLINGLNSGTSDVKSTLEKITALIEKTMAKRYKSDKAAAAATQRVIDSLKGERNALLDNERQRDRIERKLDAAHEKLKARVAEAKAYATSVKDAIVAFGNITQFVDQETSTVSAAGVIAGLKQKLEAARFYKEAMLQLADMGLNKTSLDQLREAGVEGGLATAQALVQGGAAAISEVNHLTDQLNVVGGKLGDSLADTMYGAGIDAAQALVDALESKADRLAQVGQMLGQEFIAALRAELGIGGGGIQVGKATTGIRVDQTHASGRPSGRTMSTAQSDPALLAEIRGLREDNAKLVEAIDRQPYTTKTLGRKG